MRSLRRGTSAATESASVNSGRNSNQGRRQRSASATAAASAADAGAASGAMNSDSFGDGDRSVVSRWQGHLRVVHGVKGIAGEAGGVKGKPA